MHKIFGTKEDVPYLDRPGAYLIPLRDGQVGIIRTPKGYFFLGGGIEPGENHAACLARECMEETGCTVHIGPKLCSAETYTTHSKLGFFHPIQTYYTGSLESQVTPPTEPDHTLLWMDYAQLRGKLFSEMQNWALDQLFLQ